ncbi:PAS domain S-box [Belliella baltica DSM 15883]|uniref:histidine kinase n=1 Tax=Belliella baltica (strain DSM 15883 / CIP 108006 / LMG 21964 / BA134) TaxID=866536 RepID=I3Z7E1_BELBD|nr:PAS domain-containing protein [Belliella baltica]AFL85159.1 PAS domain S-box [Belliella baltica DSM 15883]
MGDLKIFLDFVNATTSPAAIIKAEGDQLIVISSNQSLKDFLHEREIEGENILSIYQKVIHAQHHQKIDELQKFFLQSLKSQKELSLKLEDVALESLLNQNPIVNLEISNTPIKSDDGARYFMHFVKDNTELKLLQDQLKAQKILMNQAEQISGFGTWELDVSTNKITWSEGVYLICGYVPNSFEVTFEKGLGVIHPEDQPAAIEAMQQTLTTGKEYKIQKRFLLDDGTVKQILSRGTLIKDIDGKPVKLIGVFQDISDQIEAEKKVQDTLNNFQALVENVDGIMWEADAKTFEFNFVSPQVEQMLGYSAQEWLSEDQFWINHIHPDDRSQAYTYCKKMVDLGQNHIFEYRFKKKSGEYILLQDRVSVQTKLGKPDRLKGVLVDINDKYFQQKIEHLEREVMEKSMEGEVTLKEVLGLLMFKLEDVFPDLKSSMLRVDQGRVFNLVSPSLPTAFIEAIEGEPIGEDAGSCGTAAFTKKEVIVSDIPTDKRWLKYRGIAAKFGFQSCWSRPVFNKKGEVVATFANYFSESRTPRPIEKVAIERASRLASIILEHFSDLEQIKHANELNTFINKATNEAIYEWDMVNDKVYWGESFERFFGYVHQGDFTAEDWRKMMHPEDVEDSTRKLEEFFIDAEKFKIAEEHRLIKKDGTVIFAEVIGFLIRDKENLPKKLIGVIRDITETRELRKLLESASQMAKIGGWELDVRNMELYWSRMTKQIHGIPDDLEIDLEKSINFYREDFREKVKSLVNDCIKKGNPFDFEFPITTYQGQEKWVRAMGQAEFFHGACIKIYGSFQDIHARKLAERQIEQHLQDLAKSNAELEQFAYVASHDLQEPLRMVTSFLALIEKRYDPLLDEKGKTYISYAMDGAVRMRKIILDLLEFSRVGRTKESKKSVDLNEIVQNVMKMQKQAIEESNTKIYFKSLPQVNSYHLEMEQVFQNIIGNAIKYRKADLDPIIEIKAESLSNFWKISIKDNGIGIDKEYFEKVFVLFQRLHSKEEYSGTGIGLAIVKKIINSLGGEIWLESEIGVGSTFYITIPK